MNRISPTRCLRYVSLLGVKLHDFSSITETKRFPARVLFKRYVNSCCAYDTLGSYLVVRAGYFTPESFQFFEYVSVCRSSCPDTVRTFDETSVRKTQTRSRRSLSTLRDSVDDRWDVPGTRDTNRRLAKQSRTTNHGGRRRTRRLPESDNGS